MSDEEEGKKDKGGGGGAPAWMATFADLMSLLLAFFVLLFSFSSIDDKRYKEVGGSLKDAFGVQRRQLLTDPIQGVNHIAREYSSGRKDPTTLNIVAQQNLDVDAMRYLTSGGAEDAPSVTEKFRAEEESSKRANEEKTEKASGERMNEGMTASTSVTVSTQQSKQSKDSDSESDSKKKNKQSSDSIDIQQQSSKAPSLDIAFDKAQSQDEADKASESEKQAQQSADNREATKDDSDQSKAAALGMDQSDAQDQVPKTAENIGVDNNIADNVDRGQGKNEEDTEKAIYTKVKQYFEEEVDDGLLEIEVKDGKLILRVNEEGSFPPGSAETIQPFIPLVEKMGGFLKGASGDISVTGHTDSIPLQSSRYRSNWDLSAARAVTVLQGLIDTSGLPGKQFSAIGYGDTKPVADNKKARGRARNRRVEVVVELNQLASNVPEKFQEYTEDPLKELRRERERKIESERQKLMQFEEQKEKLPDPIFNLPEKSDKSLIFGDDFFTPY